jgi:hypothetical protein
MATTYEWLIETLECDCEDADIAEVNHHDTLAEARAWAASIEGPHRIGLVRDVGNDLEGITDRQWAYLDAAGRLPEFFHDGVDFTDTRVPKRFHVEVAKSSPELLPR